MTNRVANIRIISLFLAIYILFTVSDANSNHDGKETMTNTTITEIVYHFGDASVPPMYHRSFTLTVTTGKITVVVDSYGEILADESYDISATQFDDIKKSLRIHKISNCTLVDDEGCTGGTSESISYSSAGDELFSGWVYHCGGKDSGNLCGDIEGFAADVKRLVPDLEQLLL
jgi:hypothetical protein